MPKTNRKVPAVLGFGGSDPSWGFADANGAMMASKGIAVLGLVYFQAAPELPQSLDQIPIEYFQAGLDYLETVPNIDKEHFGVVSGSRGSEAAFILASYDRRVRSVVVTTPSLVAWYGMSKEIVDYFRPKNFPFEVTHRSYRTGHGFDRESASEIKAHIVTHFIETLK